MPKFKAGDKVEEVKTGEIWNVVAYDSDEEVREFYRKKGSPAADHKMDLSCVWCNQGDSKLVFNFRDNEVEKVSQS
jgi:hypothetical protein